VSRDAESLTQSAQRWLGFVALFVAPTSLITGLCYFFGLVYIRHRLDYFGVDPSTLGLTTADYVVAVVKTFFFAALRVLAVLAVLVVLAVAVRSWAATGRRIRLLRVTAWGVLFLGALSIGNGVYWLAFGVLPIQRLIQSADATYTAGSILLGSALLVAGYWMLTISGGVAGKGKCLPPTAERALLALAVTVMVVALFWITDMYAANLGGRDADFDAQHLWANEKGVQLDTTEVLSPPSSLVKASVLPSAGGPGAPTYRYECLRVLEVRNGHYVLVPAKWNREYGWAITVTPDPTHRINAILHEGLAEATGDGANVRNFWQCPEVVRYFQETDLEPMLVGTDAVQTILGGRALTAGGVDGVMPFSLDQDETRSAKPCATQENQAASTPAIPRYPDDGVATRRREMTGDGLSGPLWMQERVTTFPDPASADAFFGATQSRWGYCAGKVARVARRGAVEPRTLASPGIQQGILAVSDSAVGSSVDDCAQAIGTKSNVVIQVDVCGEQPLLAVGVVAAMQHRIRHDKPGP
jgi:PknH-like extracellular domain